MKDRKDSNECTNWYFGPVWLRVKVRKWRSEKAVIVSFRIWELVSKFFGIWMLLGSMVWKMLCLFQCLNGNVEVEKLTTSWPQNNIKIKIN